MYLSSVLTMMVYSNFNLKTAHLFQARLELLIWTIELTVLIQFIWSCEDNGF